MSEKTEKPTSKKLVDARKKGDVPHARDLTKALILLSTCVYFSVAGSEIFALTIRFIAWSGSAATRGFQESLVEALAIGGQLIALSTLPIVLIVFAVGALSDYCYSGPVFGVEKLAPRFENLNPIAKVKNWFSLQSLVDIVKSILKVAALCTIAWVILSQSLGALLLLPGGEVDAAAVALWTLLKTIFAWICGVLLVLGLIDALIQWRLFRRQHRMSKDETKREHRDTEGSHEFKSYRRQVHTELIQGEVRAAVRQATAVVVNPTHFAVALRYVGGETPLPLVKAKGAGEAAGVIVDEAMRAGIPVVRNVMLARALIATAEVDEYIPTEMIASVAELLRAIIEHENSVQSVGWF